jgi:RNA polymerase sigma factor (sigma-70 family)
MFERDPLANPEPLIRRVYAYVAYRIGDGPEAEDVTSETFERALRYRKTYRSSKGEPVGWLIGIARRCIADAVEGRLELLEPEDAISPGDLAADAVVRLDVADAMATLDERNRELIALRFGADMTARQIAQVLGLKTNAVEVALHRALGRLRAELGEPPEGGKRAKSDKRPLPDT